MISFTPEIHPLIKEYLDEYDISKIVNMVSSPCNIIFPNILKENINHFNDVFKKHNINGKIFYAHKTNKSSAIVKEARRESINIDVASLNELKHALSNGFTGDNIEATGPKNQEFILLGLQHNIIFNIDNVDELQIIEHLQRKINKKEKTKILVRISGFESGSVNIINKESRFGIDHNMIDMVLKLFKDNRNLELIGFSFHLDTIDQKEKIIAITQILKLFEKSYNLDLRPYVLNIGGGYKVNYLDNSDEWNKSITRLKESFLSDESLTWNNNTFGLSIKENSLLGTLNIYDYYDNHTGSKYLDELLSTNLEEYQNMNIGQILSENMIDLYIEPGKSLVDQLGMTVAKVNFIKESKNETLIGLDMKRSDIVIGDQEIFMDPIIISKNKQLEDKAGIYFVGNLCLETDLIYKHKVFIDKIPNIGDSIIFINTAGYFMDFNASETIMQKIADKIIVIKKNNEFIYFKDEVYNPILNEE